MAARKIGIDAKWYFIGPPSGRIVVQNLVDQMVNYHTDVELYLFIDKDFSDQARQKFGEKAKLIPLRAKPNLLSNLLFIPRLARKHNLDVVMFQNFGSWPHSRWKKVVYIHDFLFLDYPQYFSKKEMLYYKPMSYLAKRADYVITISNSEKKRIIKHGIANPDKTSVVYHGLSNNFKPLSDYRSDEIIHLNKKYNLPPQYILYVGRVNIRKNLINLIRAIEKVDKSLKLIIVGQIEFANDEIPNYIKQHRLENKVVFTGHVPDADIYLIYARARMFCFPSYAEGFGLPPLEAMKCGVPCVVSNRTAMPEICADAAVYIDPDNLDDIADKINNLHLDNNYYEEMVKRSLEHSKKFVWHISASRIMEILESLVP